MTFYTEIDWIAHAGGIIARVLPDSVAAEIGLLPGDQLMAINENKVDDVIDVHYYAAEENLELLIRRDKELLLYEAFRAYEQPLGIEFEHPTFDTDIRRCNNLCEFCFVLQMAPNFRRTLYIKDDDYRYSFLFGHYVTLTNLTDHDWWKIENMRLSPLYISVHVTDLELRRRFLRNPNAPDIVSQLRWLAEHGIQAHTQLVVVPELNDREWLERSIQELSQLWPAVLSISVVPVGLTKHHKYGLRPHTKAEAAAMLDYLEPLQTQYRESMQVGFVYPTDEWYLVAGRPVASLETYDGLQLQENGLGMVRSFLDDWPEVRREIKEWKFGSVKEGGQSRRRFTGSVTLVTGTLFAPTLKSIAAEFSALSGIPTKVEAVVNKTLGQTITVAGLLMVNDIVGQLSGNQLGDLIVLPRVVFDHPDQVSLDGFTPQEVAERVNRPVALADQMGDVWDALIGESSVLFQPKERP